MTLDLATPRRRRRPSLTPMIDVVFLLLVFFMLVARFGGEGAVALAAGGGGTGGPPRLVEVRPTGLALNGIAMPPAELLAALGRIGGDLTVLRGRDGATLQDLVAAMDLLRGAGHDRLALVE